MVALAGPDLQPFSVFLGDNVNRTIASVRLEIGRFIRDEVAAADQIVQLIKGLAQG